MKFEKRFSYSEGQLEGLVRLGEAQWVESRAWRPGTIQVDGGRELELWASHSEATEKVMYLSKQAVTPALSAVFQGIGIELTHGSQVEIPGQFILGAGRCEVVAKGVSDCLAGPAFEALWNEYETGEVALFPVLREGVKYGLAEAALSVGGVLCDEIVVDGHHTADPSVPGLGRKMELSAFKDADLTIEEREQVKVAVLGDSVASGTVIVGLIEEIKLRFPNLERVELVAPLAAVYGLARIAAFALPEIPVRIHCFETLINALEPDYYFSPHYSEDAFHIVPERVLRYREWWGKDKDGSWIADTACSGYGWSEAFFNPRKQLRMIDAELRARHNLTLVELLTEKF